MPRGRSGNDAHRLPPGAQETRVNAALLKLRVRRPHGPECMAYPQKTLEEIVDSERAMVLDGDARYGRHYKHAHAATFYLSCCVISIERDRSDTFGRLYSLMKKQHMLAFLSALRLHNVQAMMNLRQVLEAGAAAAYAIAHPKVEDFVDIDEFGIMGATQKLARKRYRWLDENYPASKWIKEKKDLINSQTAHANMVSGDRTFRVVNGGKGASNPFFDIEDEDFVKTDLWLIGSVAIMLMDLFLGVADDVARSGRSVVGFRADFEQTILGLASESKALCAELTGSARGKAAMLKIEQRAKASGKAGSRGG